MERKNLFKYKVWLVICHLFFFFVLLAGKHHKIS